MRVEVEVRRQRRCSGVKGFDGGLISDGGSRMMRVDKRLVEVEGYMTTGEEMR